MSASLCCVSRESIITGWDFSTGSVKCIAFDLDGRPVASVQYATDLWQDDDARELNLMQLEGQACATVRSIADQLRDCGRLKNWAAGGISATHHTAGRIDRSHTQVRRAICWNDQTLAKYHAVGLDRLGGQEKVKQLIGGPWAIRYSLSHLVKDEVTLSPRDWQRTQRILPHGALAAGYLTGNFDVVSVSAAASTGIMDLRTNQWRREMLDAIANPELRELAWKQLPRIVNQFEPVGRLSQSQTTAAGIESTFAPWVFPTSDDQQAGLVGGGAVEAGQVAIILGNSAVVNSSSSQLPASGNLDAMRLNWGPYLWMRCYNNGAQFLDHVVGKNPNWDRLETEARACPPGADGLAVLPFELPEPSLGVKEKRVEWFPSEANVALLPPGKRYRAALEAIAYLIALGVGEHEQAGQRITRITVSGGIARSTLMCEMLATVLDRPLERLQSNEGPALGAAVTALAALDTAMRPEGIRESFTVADAVGVLVKFREPVLPNPAWHDLYSRGLESFIRRLRVA